MKDINVRPELSFLVVNFNVLEHVQACVASICEAVEDSFVHEIIVVDNASGDGSRDVLATDGRISYKFNELNLGFGKANNQAALLATGRYIVVINPDVRIPRNFDFARALQRFSDRGDLGQLSCLVYYGNGQLQTAGEPYPSLGREICRNILLLGTRPIKSLLLRSHTWDGELREVDWVTGSFFMMPAELFRELGGFDERIFLNGEDLDLSARVRGVGRIVGVDTGLSIIHLHGAAKRKVGMQVGALQAWRNLWSTEYVIRKNRLSRFPLLIRILRWLNKIILLAAQRSGLGRREC